MYFAIIITAVSVRVLIAVATSTFFLPDEYFQSLEVAHHLVFGYGHLTWEWLTPKPIRSILYPALNVPIYWLLKILGLDDTPLLILGPKILHGIFASLTDIFICHLTTRVAGARYAKIAFILSISSFFHGLSLSRSLSNSLETSLTTIALSYYPWDVKFPSWRNDLRKSLVVAALACAVRPTNVIIWAYMFLCTIWQLRNDFKRVLHACVDALSIATLAIATLCGLDSWYYGKLTITPLHFVTTNLSSVSLFYGSNPWDFYLKVGLPLLCGLTLPYTIQGILRSLGSTGSPVLKQVTGLIVWTTGIYSMAGHKEWRFLHPLLPLLHIFAAVAMVDYHNVEDRQASNQSRKQRLGVSIRTRYLCFFSLNLLPLVYLIFFHGRAQIDVMHYLRSLDQDQTRSVGLLMPCHSTPWQAYLHRPSFADHGRFWALGCEPPIGLNTKNYKDQTDIFYESPIDYLRDRFPGVVNPEFPASPLPFTKPGQLITNNHDWKHEWPQYLVVFSALLADPDARVLLENKGYRRVWSKERGWEGDHRRQGGITVLKISS